MEKVLIVDDEYRIGLLIKSLIHWEKLEMESLSVLDNSERALQIILSQSPDVVITDMRMPKVDGLELIRLTREAGLQTKFIVVSGYREFDYAHQALYFGVEDYILKPVQENELNKALARVKEKLNTENQTMDLYKNYKESKQILRSDLMNRLLKEGTVEKPGSSILNMNGAFYCGFDMKLDYLDYREKNEREDVIVLEKIHGIVEDLFLGHVKEFLICDKEALHIYCMINYDETQRRELNSIYADLLFKVKEYLIGFERYLVTIGIGREKLRFDEMRSSIEESYRAVCNRMSLGTGRLIFFSELTCTETDEISLAIDRAFPDLKRDIEAHSREKLTKVIEQILYLDGSLTDYDFTCFYKGAQRLTEIFFQLCPEKDPLLQERKAEILEALQHCSRVRQMVNALKTFFSEIIDLIVSNKENESVLPVRLAREYVDRHFGEKIQLETIADVVNLNPVYFSALFKKETGMNFSSYLANERMEKAKKLLVDTHDTIEAIGYSVGYNDYKYFCQQFKKLVGVKPNVYRKLYM